jgi:2-polyprenyl-3-methyl-5-hydroxy-6-metoxy-1,4-benzoquinol methylase
MPSFAVRQRRPELMDSPDLDADRFIGSLAGLRRVNGVTGSARILWPEVREAAVRSGRPLRVLDVACGAGDMLIRLGLRARSAGLRMELHGCDVNPLAVGFAREQSAAAGVSGEFFQFDAVRDPVPAGFDLILSSFFLHHLEEADAAGFLRRASEATRGSVFIHDLVRSRAGYWLAALGIPALLCNDVCRVDGPRSVESAFTLAEARAIADRAGLEGARLTPRFPFRFLLRWDRP